MKWQRLAGVLLTAASFGWLSSGSCQVSYCSEDCDPCVVQCRCQTSVCYYGSSTLRGLHTLTQYERSEGASADVLHQTFRDIRGVSLQFLGAAPEPSVEDCVRFARGILSVNARLFDRPGVKGEFTLVQSGRCEGGTLVQFQRGAEADATDLVILFFDVGGSLLQIDHDARR